MSSRPDYSKKILKFLSKKTAVAVTELQLGTESKPSSKKVSYALTRSFKGLKESGMIECLQSGQNEFARLTMEGKKKVNQMKIEGDSTLLDPSWDGKWRIILLDLPEIREKEPESLRYLLKKAGFVLLKNSAWISPYPFENLFFNIKKDLGFKTEIMIVVSKELDEETEKEIMKSYFE